MRLRQSLRDALRSIHRQPAHAALVVTLAIGIGATTAMFSVVDTLLIRPLPYADAERLIELGTAPEETKQRSPGLSPDAIHAIRGERIFQAVEADQFGASTLTGDGDASLVSAPLVSPGLFPLLGVTPHLGRLFADDDTRRGASR